MLLQAGEPALWAAQQAAFYEQARDALRSHAGSLPPIEVESVRVGRGRALVVLREPLVQVRGQAAQSLGQYAFFTLEREGWAHAGIGDALHWRVPLARMQRAPVLPRAELEDGVTWITYVSSEPHSQAEARAVSFEAQHPGIRVRILDMSDVLAYPEEVLGADHDRLLYLYQLLAYQGALMGDVMEVPSGLGIYGLARDLTPFLEADRALAEDFYPGLLRACQDEGQTWALPGEGYPFLIFYDKDAFDAAGIAYPQPGWTEAEFLDIARQLTLRGDAVRRYGFLNRTGLPFGRVFVEAQAGPLMDGAGQAPAPRLDGPQVVEAVHWYTGLALQERVMPNPFEWLSLRDQRALVGRMWNVAQHGQAAMWIEEAGAWRRYQERENVGVVSFPVSPYPGSPWWFEAYVISAESDDPQASWLWVRDLTAHGREEEHGHETYLLPARRSVAERAGAWAQWDDEIAAAIRAAMEQALIYRLDECTLTLEMAIESIWAGLPVQDALEQAQAQLVGE
jgi:multiple sugar transport system substrate-binding protein